MGQITWYKRYPEDALAGMMGLSLEERGAYNSVLDLIYTRDGRLPDDDRFIAGWLGCDVRVWKRIKTRLVELGKLYSAGGVLSNRRADEEVVTALARVGSARDAGKASARSKARKSTAKANENKAARLTDVATGEPTGVPTNQNTEPDITPLPPKGGRGSKSVISEDWSVPAIADLTPKARECAQQWPPGAYETHGEAFHAYWRSERRMKADWRLTWANRVIALHGQVMRDHRWSSSSPSGGQRFGSEATSLFEHKLAQKREARA